MAQNTATPDEILHLSESQRGVNIDWNLMVCWVKIDEISAVGTALSDWKPQWTEWLTSTVAVPIPQFLLSFPPKIPSGIMGKPSLYCGFHHSALVPTTIGSARASTVQPILYGDCFYGNLYLMHKNRLFTLFLCHVLWAFIAYLIFYVEIAI